MNHRYYCIEPDGFWVEAHNPAWSNNPKLADAWSWILGKEKPPEKSTKQTTCPPHGVPACDATDANR